MWKRSAGELQIRPFRKLRNVRDTFVELLRYTGGCAKIKARDGRRVMRSRNKNSGEVTEKELDIEEKFWKLLRKQIKIAKTNPEVVIEQRIIRHSYGHLGRVGRRRRSTTQHVFTPLQFFLLFFPFVVFSILALLKMCQFSTGSGLPSYKQRCLCFIIFLTIYPLVTVQEKLLQFRVQCYETQNARKQRKGQLTKFLENHMWQPCSSNSRYWKDVAWGRCVVQR